MKAKFCPLPVSIIFHVCICLKFNIRVVGELHYKIYSCMLDTLRLSVHIQLGLCVAERKFDELVHFKCIVYVSLLYTVRILNLLGYQFLRMV